jgi:hypothetical protein
MEEVTGGLQHALEKQVFINKFQIPQFTTMRRAQVVQWTDHPFPVGGSRFESTGTLTNLLIVQGLVNCHLPSRLSASSEGKCKELVN